MGGMAMKTGKVLFLALVLVASLFAAVGARAQNLQRGEVRGFVFDASHAVVPKAKVTIFNPSTGYKHDIETDDTGSYGFPQLLPGVYQITAEAAGFASITLKNVTVEIGASLSLDITLPVKGQAQSVTVSGAVGAVDTTTAGINQIINQRNVEDLPLSGRDYRDLAELSPSGGVVPGLRGGIRLGGQQSDYLGMVIDGQDNYDNFFGEIFGSLETKNFTIPLEAVQEFQVVANGFAPEFGRATGGIVNVVTKSGTNQVHGEAHEYYRGSSLTKNDALGFAPNINNQNQFGGSIGFPIHKDRQFLFLATDVQREDGPLTTDFCSSLTVSACQSLLSTITGPTFSSSTIPAGFQLPKACGPPTAGGSILTDCYGVANLGGFLGSGTQFQNLFTVLGHYDYQLTPANHFSIRGYGTRNHTNGFTGGLGQNEIQAAFNSSENFINQGISGVFALNTALGREVNEIRVSVEGETRKRHSNGAGEPTILINNFCPPPSTSCTVNGSTISGSGSILFGERYYLPINNDLGKLQAADNFSYVFGKHDFKFGGDVDSFVDRKDSFVGWSTGEFVFNTLADFQANSITGVPFNQGVGLNNVSLFKAGTLFPAYQTGLGLYWQDKWAITPRFTLTYGLRWDGTWNPQPQTPFPGSQIYAGSGPLGSGTTIIPVPQRVPNDFKQWGPRIGFAWNVGGTDHPTVIRGAWGYYYAQSPTIFLPTGGGGKTAGIFCFAPSCLPPGAPFIFPSSIPQGPNQLCSVPQIGCAGPNFVDPSFQNPRVSNLTGGVERTLARNWTVTATVAWVNSQHLRTGGYGTEEAWARNFTQCPAPNATDAFGRAILCGFLDPTLSPFTNATGSFAHGNYESAVLNVTKRFSKHFQVFANYLWSQNKDNGASERDTDTYFGQQDPFNINLDYGRNSLDIRHQFKAAGVYELPMGFLVSSTVIARSGLPYPIYVNTDINGDLVANSTFFHNNDRPSITLPNGKTVLLGRYPFTQPGFAEWDARVQKDFGFKERYHLQLSADLYNVTNRGNVKSNSDTTATIDYMTAGSCVARPAPQMGLSCQPLTAATFPTLNVNGTPLRFINQVAEGSTPFAFQGGIKFIF